jgi:hypothetical protein
MLAKMSPFLRYGFVPFFLCILFRAAGQKNLAYFIDPGSLILVGGPSLWLYLAGRKQGGSPLGARMAFCGAWISGTLGTLISAMLMLTYLTEAKTVPANIGPAVAIGLITWLYAFVIMGCCLPSMYLNHSKSINTAATPLVPHAESRVTDQAA